MKSSIKTCLVKSERIVSLTKFTFCTAVIVSLAFTANVSVLPTIFLDADTPATGSNLVSTPLVTSYGTITFVGEIVNIDASYPPSTASTRYDYYDFTGAGAAGNAFDIQAPAPEQAEMSFDFDVYSVSFIYGGKAGEITVHAEDEYGVAIETFHKDSTFPDGGVIDYAGRVTLTSKPGRAIRSLYWEDTWVDPIINQPMEFAALDNIVVTIIPSPSAFVLAGIGVSFVGWLRKRKIV